MNNRLAIAFQEKYKIASELRVEASKTCDPDLYVKAGNLFIKIGMPESAQRCFDRAEHYQENL